MSKAQDALADEVRQMTKQMTKELSRIADFMENMNRKLDALLETHHSHNVVARRRFGFRRLDVLR